MADEVISPQTPTPADTTTPDVPAAQGTPTITQKDIEGKTPDEIVKFVSERSEALGSTKKELEDYKSYVNTAKPYIDVISSDPELTKQVEAAYQKKYNPEPAKTETPSGEINKVDDTRRALENGIISQFESQRGLDKLDGDTKKEMNVKIGQELMDILDPSGTKNLNEVLSGVSLEKLPRYLDKAYKLATINDVATKAKEEAIAEISSGANGIMSSIPSSSPNASDVGLTPQERVLAERMGVSEAKWLENKKMISNRLK
jgi:hypothetical protein